MHMLAVFYLWTLVNKYKEWLPYGAKTHKWKILLGIKFANKKNKTRSNSV